MNKFFKVAAVLLTMFGSAEVATAQQLNLTTNPNDPVTGLPPAQWAAMEARYLQLGTLVGTPYVAVMNATSEELTLTCDKWTIVGANVYKSVVGNPAALKPFSITIIKTNEFDGYCKDGVVGHPQFGNVIRGQLNDTNGSFTDATLVTFLR